MVLGPVFRGGDLKDVSNAEQGLPRIAVRDHLKHKFTDPVKLNGDELV